MSRIDYGDNTNSSSSRNFDEMYGDARHHSDVYELLDEHAIINQPLPTYLIDGLLPEDGVCLLTGQKGVYKSFMGFDMALTMTHELLSYHGRQAQAGGAIYFAGEGAGGLGKRLAAWRQFHRIDGRVKSPFWLVRTPTNLLNEEDIERIIRSIKETEDRTTRMIKTIWVDTVSRAIQGAKEDEQTWGGIIGNAERIKAALGHPMSFIGIAHQGKDSSRGTRGSSVAECNADCVLSMYSDKELSPDEVRLHVTKLKDDEDGRTFNFVTCRQEWTTEQGKVDSLVLIEEREETDEQRAARLETRRLRLQTRRNKQPDTIELLEQIANLPPNLYLISEVVKMIGKTPGRINEKVLAAVPTTPTRVGLTGQFNGGGFRFRFLKRITDPLRGHLIEVSEGG